VDPLTSATPYVCPHFRLLKVLRDVMVPMIMNNYVFTSFNYNYVYINCIIFSLFRQCFFPLSPTSVVKHQSSSIVD